MTYIIDPMWFYWLGVIDSLNFVVAFAFVVSIFALVVSVIGYTACRGSIANYPDLSDGERARMPVYVKCFKASLVLFLVIGIALVFLPSKDTLIEMQVAKLATVENAEWTVDTIKSAVDYIVEAIKSIG